MVLNRNCPICDKRNGEKIEHICMNVPENYRLPDSYNIVVCDNCGMVYADTSASVEDYDWYYTNSIFMEMTVKMITVNAMTGWKIC